MNQFIYEAVDDTNDEVYYSIGVWGSLDGAVRAIFGNSVYRLDDAGSSDEGLFSVSIRRRRLDEIAEGVDAVKFVWTRGENGFYVEPEITAIASGAQEVVDMVMKEFSAKWE